MRTGGPTSSQKTPFESAERPGDDREARQLRRRHQVPGRLGMRDRERAAARDLPPEERQDASRPSRPRSRAGRMRSGRAPPRVPPRRRSTRRRSSSARARSSARLPCPSRTARGARHPTRRAASTTHFVPSTFVATPSTGCASSRGTCLYAAAWKTTSGRCRLEHLDHPRRALDVGEDGHGVREAVLVAERSRRARPAAPRPGRRGRASRTPSRVSRAQSSAPIDPAGAGDEHGRVGEVLGERSSPTSMTERPSSVSTETSAQSRRSPLMRLRRAAPRTALGSLRLDFLHHELHRGRPSSRSTARNQRVDDAFGDPGRCR